uniref:Uncharacterized protein n=1 Tax=Amazona collaria TaxID=241587 RepID=A0A8B9IUM3_9PSIT
MDVSNSPERNPCSPDEEYQQLSDEEVLKGCCSDRELDGEGGQGSIMEEEEDATRGLGHGEEENRSDEEDRLSEPKSHQSDNNEQSGELKSPPPRKGEEEDGTNDLGDEASSVTRELDEHELDYDEEVPEEPSAAALPWPHAQDALRPSLKRPSSLFTGESYIVWFFALTSSVA